MNNGQSCFRICGMTAALIGGIRAVDWWLPMGIAVPMLSVVPVLVSSWIPRYRAILLTTAIVSLLTLINLLWAPSSVLAWIVLCNRFFAVVVIWVTAILCMRRVQDEHRLCVAHAGIEQQIEAAHGRHGESSSTNCTTKKGCEAMVPAKILRQAEARLRATRRDVAAMPVKDVQQLVHELQVHQIELEMQNAELRRTRWNSKQHATAMWISMIFPWPAISRWIRTARLWRPI